MRNLSFENELNLHENEPVGGTHFHMNGFAIRLVLTRYQKGTRKWPIYVIVYGFYTILSSASDCSWDKT